MLAFPHTRVWSRSQKALIIASSLVALTAVAVFAYSFQQSHGLPDESILVGTWEMTVPFDPNRSTLLCLGAERVVHWHAGSWIRSDRAGPAVFSSPWYATDKHDYSSMAWYAGGPYIYIRFLEDPMPQIWQIVDTRPEQLRLRHANKDYVFKRFSD